jgi:hypothetical protein
MQAQPQPIFCAEHLTFSAKPSYSTRFISGVQVAHIRHEDWGKEGSVHDPAGVLWHIGEFDKDWISQDC